MKYRPSGKTGLNMSGLNFGASSPGEVFHHVDETQAIRAMPTALVPLNIDGYNLGSVTTDDNGDGTGSATFDVNANAAKGFYGIEEL